MYSGLKHYWLFNLTFLPSRLGLILFFFSTLAIAFDLQASSNSEKVSLQLRWHHQFQFAGYYAAIEQGYYEEVGLEVEVIPGAPGAEPVKEVLQGRATYGVANSELLHQRLKGEPLVALAAIFQHSASVFLARQDSDIHNPQDLIGRKVMMVSRGADVGLLAMLHNEGIDLNEINIVKSSYNIDSLISGEVDAFNAYQTNEPYFMALHDIAITIIHPSTYGVDFYSDILFTTEEEIKQNPKRVKKFREASLKGWKYAMDFPEATIDLIIKKYNQQGKSREHLRYEAESMRHLIMPNVVEYGHMNPGRWAHMADVFVNQGMAEPGYNLDGFIYESDPHSDHSRWHTIALSLMLGMFATVTTAAALLYYNRKLQNAIKFGQKVQNRLQKQTALLEAIFKGSPDATVICSLDGDIIQCNQSFERHFGYTQMEAIGQPVSLFYESQASYEEMRSKHFDLTPNHFNDYETQYRRKSGELFPCQAISGPIVDAEGKIFGSILVMRDITAQKHSQQEIIRMALTDHLTGLANRHQFNRRLKELLNLARRQNQLLSLAIMDLDLFKQVNDQYGHPIGDKLLIKIAEILKQTFRETDIIARIGGDEFAILMLNPSDHIAICQPAHRLIHALKEKVPIDGLSVQIGVSFGVATYPLDTHDAHELYQLADKALYLSKECGRNRCSLACGEAS